MLVRAEDADQPVDLVVVGGYVFVGDRPVVTQPVATLALEVVRPESEGNAAPVIGPAADHTGAPPAECGAGRPGVGLARNLPSADAGVELPERPLGRRLAAARRLVRPREHRRVFRV